MNLREVLTLIPLVFLVFLIGLKPEVLLSYMHTSVEHLVEQVRAGGGQDTLILYSSVESIANFIKGIF